MLALLAKYDVYKGAVWYGSCIARCIDSNYFTPQLRRNLLANINYYLIFTT